MEKKEQVRPNRNDRLADTLSWNRLWFVSNRGEVLCLDAEGFRDGENDGQFTSEKLDQSKVDGDELHESDIVWQFDMMKELGVRQHNMATCAPTIWGDVLFRCLIQSVVYAKGPDMFKADLTDVDVLAIYLYPAVMQANLTLS